MTCPLSRRRILFASLAFTAALSLSACETAPPAKARSADIGKPRHNIQVTSNGWHSEVVIPAALLPEGAIPETADFPRAEFYAFGWGDADYYPAQDPDIAMTLRAAFTPTPAVVHLVGLPAAPKDLYANAEIIDLEITEEGLTDLVDYLDGSFARKSARRTEVAGPGLYSFSRFYDATGEFHLFNTCNSWTARALATAGLPVKTGGMQRAEDLLAQLRPLAAKPTGQGSGP
jgi:uncharacterized protein (TIGR02117 family)